MRIRLLLFAFIQVTTLTSAFAADVEHASKSRKWHLLLHYRTDLILQQQSEIAPSNFFLSPQGRSSPRAELQATIDSFENKPELMCRYPARLRFLKEELGLKFRNVKCESYENWRSLFVPQSISLVFASAFFGNAASAFGHTFLRIDGSLTTPNGPRSALLDHGLNFAAQTPPQDNAFVFAYKGLTGGYRGEFSVLPYIEKVQEYRDREERDLWEYRLNLTSEQISRLLEHLYELETSYIPYYFLNKNCSYHLLALLEVANPAWHLTDSFTYWTLPTDTVRVVAQTPNAVTDIKYRPSLHRLLKTRLKLMSATEKANFLALRADAKLPLSSDSSLVLDSLLDEQKFRYGLDSKKYPAAEQARLKSLLQARATAKASSFQIQPDHVPELRVDLAGASRKISLAAGEIANEKFQHAEFRAAYHDALDADQGALSFSEISVLHLRLRHNQDTSNNIHLEKLNLLKIVSLSPIDELQTRLSWMLDAGITTAPDEAAARIGFGKSRQLQAGLGYSTYLMREQENLLVFSFLKLNVEHSDTRHDHFRYGPSAQVGLAARLSNNLKASLNTEYFSYFKFDQSKEYSNFNFSELQLSWILKADWNVRLEKRFYDEPSVREQRLLLSRYF